MMSYRRQRNGSRQQGYILLGVLLALALILVGLSVALPRVATQIKRDREEEAIRRGTQYARAIKRFYRKFGRYPTSIEQLENTNNIRFLRQRYKDPITGKDEWRLIRFGQQRVTPRTFGGPGGQQQPGQQLGTPMGASGARGAQPGTQPGTQPGSTAGSQPGSAIGQQIGQQLGSGTMGGGPIVGVSINSEEESLKELNGKNHYNEWEFVYDPRFDPQLQGVGMGQPGGQQLGPGQQQRGPGQQPGPQPPAGPGGGRSNFPPR